MKNSENVQDTINELELVKSRLVGKAHFDNLGVKNWQVSPGTVATDIIWTNIDIYMQSTQKCQKFLATIGPIFISCFVVFVLLMIESLALNFMDGFSPIIMYLTTTVAIVYTIYGTPWLTFKFLEKEKFYLKSSREQTYMERLVLQLFFVVIVVPMIFNYILVRFSPEGFRETPTIWNLSGTEDILTTQAVVQTRTTMQTILIEVVAYIDEYYIRFILQAASALIALQQITDSDTIIKAFLSSYKVPGKTKFKHFLYDLGLRNCLAVTFFTLCLFASLMVPITAFGSLLLFTIGVSSLQTDCCSICATSTT
jgi:hypothetical protein